VMGALAVAALLLAVVGVMVASAYPDGLEKLAQQAGIAAGARTLFQTPFSDYETAFVQSPWLRKASAGVAGLALIYGVCLALGHAVGRRKGA
jgi:hypothetical protein